MEISDCKAQSPGELSSRQENGCNKRLVEGHPDVGDGDGSLRFQQNLPTQPCTPFELATQGYFRLDGAPDSVGVNYWPCSCGVEMWRGWPAEEIQHDVQLVRKLGLNCVRIFLRWEDFEPEQGRYNATAFRRLDRLLGWCKQNGLLAPPPRCSSAG